MITRRSTFAAFSSALAAWGLVKARDANAEVSLPAETEWRADIIRSGNSEGDLFTVNCYVMAGSEFLADTIALNTFAFETERMKDAKIIDQTPARRATDHNLGFPFYAHMKFSYRHT